MKRIFTVVRLICLAIALITVGAFALLLFGPESWPTRDVFNIAAVRVVAAVCMGLTALYILAAMAKLAFFTRPDPRHMRLEGNQDIEVSTAALVSVARIAAQDPEVMIESVRARVVGRDRATAKIRIEAIALSPLNLKGLAHRLQERVKQSCEEQLGVSGITVSVCFLPSKTTSVTKEVQGE